MTRFETAVWALAATEVTFSSALPSQKRFSIFDAWSAVTEKPVMSGSPSVTVADFGVPLGRAKLLLARLNVPAASISTSGTSMDFAGPTSSPEMSVENAPLLLLSVL